MDDISGGGRRGPLGRWRELVGLFVLSSFVFICSILTVMYPFFSPHYFCRFFYSAHSPLNWPGTLFATFMSCFLEALTDQIDNIILPLHFMIMLNACA